MRVQAATAVIVVGVALAFLSCGGPQERKAHYRMKAQEYIEAGNFPKARVALRNVLKIDPKDAEAYFLVAQLEEKEKNWRNAVANYQQVVELVPDHKGALITLAKYYLEARLADQVIQATDKVLAKNPEDPQAMALKIAVKAQDQKMTEALSQAEALSRRHSTEPDVAILLAALYSQRQRLRDAETILRRALYAHPHHIDLLRHLSTVLMDAGDSRAAEAVLRQIIGEEPSIFDHRLKLARFYDQQQAVDRAESLLREAIRLTQEKEQPWLALIDFLKQRRGKLAAENALLEAGRELPYSSKIRFRLAALYEEENEGAKARSVYESLIREYDEKPAGVEAQVKIAALDFAAGRHGEAEERLAGVLKQNPRSADGLILQGKIALARRNGKEAVQAFRTVLRDQPELAHVQVLLGQAHLMSGEAQLARESFERGVALHPKQVEAKLALAMLESQAGNLQRARTRLEEIVTVHPDHVRALEMLFSLDLVAQDWGRAKATYAKLRAAVGKSPTAFMAEGRLYEAQRQFAKAIAAFEQAMAADPDSMDPLLAIIKLEVGLNQIDRTRARLETLLAARPDHPYGHGLLGEVLALTGRRTEADTRFRTATSVNPGWITPWLNWATLNLAEQKPEVSVRILTKGLAVNPDSEELHMMLASVLSDQGQVDAAIAEYGAVLRMNPRNVFSANNLAVLLVDYKGDVASLEKAFVLSRDFEREASYPVFLDTLGWVRLKMGHLDHALRVMKEAIAKAPDLQALNYHFGMALYQSGNKQEAKLYLSNALKKPHMFVGRQAAEQLLAQTSG